MPGHKLSYVQMLKELHRPDLDLEQLESVIKRDVSLSYKLLRYINSAFFSLRVEIRSVRHALAMLGEDEFRRWGTLLLLSDLGADKPMQLLFDSVLTARFMEILAPSMGLRERGQDLFLAGMFSRVDALMDQPLVAVLADIPLAQEVKSALVDGSGPLSGPLALCRAYERGQWQDLTRLAAEAGLAEERLPELFLQANEWVQAGFEGVGLG